MPTLILCDNAGQCERLDELLADRTRDGIAAVGSPATLAVGRARRRIRRPAGRRRSRDSGCSPTTRSSGASDASGARGGMPAGTSLEAVTALKPGDYVVHLEHGVGIFRGIETIFVKESTVEVAVVEYEGGDRLNVPLYRIDQLERYRAASDVSADAPPPRLHQLGWPALGAAARPHARRDPGDDDASCSSCMRAARSRTGRRTRPMAPGSGSSSRRFSSRIRRTSARRLAM